MTALPSVVVTVCWLVAVSIVRDASGVKMSLRFNKESNTTAYLRHLTRRNLENGDGSAASEEDGKCFVRQVTCDRCSKYRSITGFCNNLNNPEWGSAFSLFHRLATNVYEDGRSSPRSKSVDGSPLPSARAVSLAVHGITEFSDPQHTHLLMQWGQFLDHDLSFTPVPDEDLDCSDCNTTDPLCFPIPIPANDNVFTPGTCMSLVRSTDARIRRFDFREQINEITSYMDSSNVYGSEVALSNSLRTFVGGRLKTRNNQDEFLPEDPDQSDCSSTDPDGRGCFLAGDKRSNEQMGLSSMHHLWVLEHNRIAKQLRDMNVQWRDDDQCLFLETRRIIGALHQRITYAEFLPIVLGRDIREKFHIVEEQGSNYFYGHDQHCDASITNEFATAAFRFGHSLVNAVMQVRRQGQTLTHNIGENFFDPKFLYEDSRNYLNMLAGAFGQQCLRMDRQIHEALRDKLFQNSDDNPTDLASRNIQRGRDHGIPSYTAFRKHFGLPAISDFSDLDGVMTDAAVTALQTVYSNVSDIDLWTGIVAELPSASGGLLGDLGQHILAEQFSRLKRCDRYFYSNSESAINKGAFTPEQLMAIRSVKLSNVMCNFLFPGAKIQGLVMKLVSANNPELRCSDVDSLDLTPWRSTTPCEKVKCDVNRSVCPARCIPEGPCGNDVGVTFGDPKNSVH